MANENRLEENNQDVIIQSETPRKWTVIIYMAGDNNLSQDMITAINGIEKAAKNAVENKTHTGEVTIVVEFDGQHPVADTRRYIFTKKSDITSIVIDPEINGAVVKEQRTSGTVLSLRQEVPTTSEALENLIKFSVREFPAENYAIIFSGHTDAFLGKTLLLDENPSNAMTLQTLEEVLAKVTKEVFPKKQKFDVMAFDSCIMNIFEVAYELGHLTDFWIGSQGSIPNFTWDYLGITEDLVRTPGITPRRFSEIVVDRVQSFNLNYAFGGRSIDISSWKLVKTQMDNIMEKISVLAEILTSKILEDFELISHTTKKREDSEPLSHLTVNSYSIVQRLLLKAHNMCQTYMYEQAVDIKDFSQCLKIECLKVIRDTFMVLGRKELEAVGQGAELADAEKEFIRKGLDSEGLSEKAIYKLRTCDEIYTACEHLIEAVDAVEIYGAFTGPDYRFSSGISLFFPWTQLSFQIVRKEYKDLQFTKSPIGGKWEEFLFHYTWFTARELNLEELLEKLNIKVNPGSELLKLNSNNTFSLNVEKSRFVESVRTVAKTEDSRDNPKLTKGFLEFLYYFARVRNVYPDLDAEGKFPKLAGKGTAGA